MNKKFLSRLASLLTALTVSVTSVGLGTFSFADDGVADVSVEKYTLGDIEAMSIDECIDYVDSIKESETTDIPEVGVYGEPITDVEAAAIQRVLDYDYGRAEADDPEGTGSVEFTYMASPTSYRTNYYYNYLSSSQKAAYDAIDAACINFYKSTSLDLSSEYIATVNFDTPLDSLDDVRQVLYAYYYSNPYFMFLRNGFRYGTNFSYIVLKCYDVCQTASSRVELYNSVDSFADAWVSTVDKLNSDVAKEIKLAQLISDRITYTSTDYDQSMLGGVAYGECVCNGYAMTMNYLCNLVGFRTITVTSYNHAWNRVVLNGKWYEADVTWYDQDGYYWTTWLNKSTATFLANDSNGSHVVEVGENALYNNVVLPECLEDDPEEIPYDQNTVKITSHPKDCVSVDGGNAPFEVTATGDGLSYTWQYRYPNSDTWRSATVNNSKINFINLTLNNDGVVIRCIVYDEYGNSEISETATLTVYPAAPTVTATAGDGKVTLTWNIANGVDSFTVKGGSDSTVYAENITEDTYTITGLTNGKEYTFRVFAYGKNKWSEAAVVTATPVCTTVQNLKATAGDGKVTLSWTAPTGATAYTVKGGSDSTVYASGIKTNSYTVTGLTNGTEYTFRVFACVDGKWGKAVAIKATPTSSTVQNLKAVAGDGKVTLSWTAPSGATAYTIKGGSDSTVYASGIKTNSYTVTGLTNGKEYPFRVFACVNGKWGSAASVKATPVSTTVQKLKAVAGDGKITLSWTAPTGATAYTIKGGSDSTVYASGIKTTSYTVTGLTNGKEYTFRVFACVNGKWGSAVAIKATPVTTVPQNLKAVVGNGKVTLSWTAVSGATAYTVKGGSDSTVYASGIKTNSYTVTGLTNGKQYIFRVFALVNGKWSSAATVKATPVNTVPRNVKATAGDGKVVVSWTAVSGATAYTIKDSTGSTVYASGIKTNSYTISGLTNGKSYTFKVYAYVNGWSAPSATVTATPVAPVPQNVKAVAGSGKVTISWSAMSGATAYTVKGASDSTVYASSINTTSYTVTGLTNGKAYTFRVFACVNGKWTAASAAVTATPYSNAPKNVMANVSSGKVTLTWSAVSGATKYAVKGGSDSTIYSSSVTGTSYTVTGLTNGKEYAFRVFAYVGGAWSEASETVLATPMAI